MASTPVFAATPKITPAAFTNADAANTKKTIATAGSAGMKVVSVHATSTDTSARVAQLWLTRSATSYLLGSISVPAGAGNDGATAVADLMGYGVFGAFPVDSDGQHYVFLENGDTLQASFTTQVTAAKEIDVVSIAGNL